MKVFMVLIVLLSFMISMSLFGKNDEAKELKVGDKAPDFSLKDDSGKVRSLSDFEGKRVVVYFYPKDDTPGCTKEACGFRDDYDKFAKEDIVVLGISYDSVESHKKFKEKYNLPFILLSDEQKEVAKKYNASGGLINLTAKRMTYLLDENGKIIHIFDKVAVTEHSDEVIQVYNNMAKIKKEK